MIVVIVELSGYQDFWATDKPTLKYPRAVSQDEAAARAAELREQIERAGRLYYEQDAPEISDAEYDALFRELVQLEDEHPELAIPDSPTQRVGGAPSGQLTEVRHSTPMLSLNNAFSHDEVRAFDARVRRLLGLTDEEAARSSATAPSSRSMGWRSARGMAAAVWRRRRRAATERPARTSPQTSARSSRSPSASASRCPSRRAARSSCPRPSSRASTPSARRPACRSTPTRATAARARCARSIRRSPRAGGSLPGSTC